MSDRQCPSCGGICKKSGCERANIDPMDDPLKRIIADQQKTIDHLNNWIDSARRDLNTVFSRHESLFESFARLIDARVAFPSDRARELREYQQLRHECRAGMLEEGYCMTCYNFICECDGQYD